MDKRKDYRICIIEMLDLADERKLKLIFCYIQAILESEQEANKG